MQVCSRQYSEVNRQLADLNFKIDPVHFLRCKSNGNYEPFQVVDNYTYCLNTSAAQITSEKDRPVFKKDVDSLGCAKEHKYWPYVSECEKRYNEAIKDIKLLEEAGHLVVGYDVPKCDIDGTYAPVQCLNSYCYCVKKTGEKYRGTQVDRNDPEFALNQNCNCVRELEMIRELRNRNSDDKNLDKITELYSQYKCDRNGNYLPLQCSESACYCVDETYGYQVNASALKTDSQAVQALGCYQDYPEQYRLNDIYDNQFSIQI